MQVAGCTNLVNNFVVDLPKDEGGPQKSVVSVVLSNTGNIPITEFGIKLTIQETGAVIFDDPKITDLSKHACGRNIENKVPQVDEEGNRTGEMVMDPTATDDAGVLWPGQSVSFLFEYTVPNGSPSQFTVEATLYDKVDCNESYLFNNEMATNSSITQIIDPRTHSCTAGKEELLTANGPDGDDDDEKSPTYYSEGGINVADFILYDEDGEIVDQTHPNAVNNDNSPLQHTDYVMPFVQSDGSSAKTSDDTGAQVGLGGALIGAAAAAVAAYEKRRAENEDK